MEWIETTGKTVEEAKDRALDVLGIEESELEYEVVQEPRGGLIGRISGSSAHVRARVRPISREKPDRGRRRGRGRGDRRGGKSRGKGSGKRGSGRQGGQGSGDRDTDRQKGDGRSRGGNGRSADQGKGKSKGKGNGSRDQRSGGRDSGRSDKQKSGKGSKAQRQQSKERAMSEVPVEEQAEMAEEFAQGLVEAFGLDGSARAEAQEDRVVIDIEGDDLGVLIGPDGSTMESVRELVKTALQRQTAGQNARVSLDVGGYHARRRAALEKFARQVAEKALDTGREQALEPMTPPDRKVVHDAVNEIDGVSTESEGEEPRRRVVITPDPA